MKKRTDVDFSKHELLIEEKDGLKIHHLKIPGTITNSVKFINVEGVMVVTGDFGDWIFCREFHPSADGGVSYHYWVQKAQVGTTQKLFDFDAETAKKQIENLLKDDDLGEEEKEWLIELSCEADQGEYSYIAKAMNRPYTFDSELIPDGKIINSWLLIIFDAFEEICKRLKEGRK